MNHFGKVVTGFCCLLVCFSLQPSDCFSKSQQIDAAYRHLCEVMDKTKIDKTEMGGNRPRFLRSYETFPDDPAWEGKLANTGFSYDNALALIAFLAQDSRDGLRRARVIADAFLQAQGHDRYYQDGRLRNAYASGTLPENPGEAVLPPGWWNRSEGRWYEDKDQVGTTTGNMAWVGLALLSFHDRTGEKPYLDAALKLGEWIERETRSPFGYTGGYVGWEPTPQKITWLSTEHHIDLYRLFLRLFAATGDVAWKDRAQVAKTFIASMWNGRDHHFWTGLDPGGIHINASPIPIDIQAWAIAAMPGEKPYRGALRWAEKNGYKRDGGFSGFDFDTDKDGVWFEGTAQMALAYRIAGENGKADDLIAELKKAQALAPEGNGKGLVAASRDGLTTGFEWKYYRRLHVGATAWYLFAQMAYNPFLPRPSP